MSTPDPTWRQRQAALGPDVTFELDWQVTLISTNVVLQSCNPYGSVTDGMLMLRGCFKTAHLQKISEEDVFGCEFFDAELYGLRCPGRIDAPFDRLCSCHIDVPSGIEDNSIVTCLPIIEEKERRDGRLTGLSRSHGLILCMIPNDSRQYRRIGHFATSLANDRKWLSG